MHVITFTSTVTTASVQSTLLIGSQSLWMTQRMAESQQVPTQPIQGRYYQCLHTLLLSTECVIVSFVNCIQSYDYYQQMPLQRWFRRLFHLSWTIVSSWYLKTFDIISVDRKICTLAIYSNINSYRNFLKVSTLSTIFMYIHCVSEKMHQFWNDIARNYRGRFWWCLAEIFERL